MFVIREIVENASGKHKSTCLDGFWRQGFRPVTPVCRYFGVYPLCIDIGKYTLNEVYGRTLCKAQINLLAGADVGPTSLSGYWQE